MKITYILLLSAVLIPNVLASEQINDENWEQHPTVKKIRAIYTEINNAQNAGKLKKQAQKCELDDGNVVMEGEIYSGSDSIVRKYVVDGGTGDSRARAEYYYSKKGIPRFTYRFRGAYNGTQVEERIYFDKNGTHLYTNRKEQGPGYTPSGLTDSVEDPQFDYANLCNE